MIYSSKELYYFSFEALLFLSFIFYFIIIIFYPNILSAIWVSAKLFLSECSGIDFNNENEEYIFFFPTNTFLVLPWNSVWNHKLEAIDKYNFL